MSVPAAAQSQGELYVKLQEMEQEIMALRGKIEEQEYLIRKLTRQRQDDYVDLDRRISRLSQQGSAPAPSYVPPAPSGRPTEPAPQVANRPAPVSRAPAPSASSAAPAAPIGDPAQEKAAYLAAYDLVKQEQFDNARAALSDFLLLYPRGTYAPNAHYWLGQLYLHSADLNNAITQFNIVVDSYPSHRKAPDAMLKLGKAYHVKGDVGTARTMLNRVITEHRSTQFARMAREYLNDDLGG